MHLKKKFFITIIMIVGIMMGSTIPVKAAQFPLHKDELEKTKKTSEIPLYLNKLISLENETITCLKGTSGIIPLKDLQVASMFEWKSTNPNICTIDEKGIFQAVNGGEAVIFAVNENQQITTKIVVENPTISESEITGTIGDNKILSVTGTTNNITWYSENSDICSVDEFGNLTLNTEGTTMIHAKIEHIILSTQITVIDPLQEKFRNMQPLFEACLGIPYDFGDRSPLYDTNNNGINGLDCSAFVCYVLNGIGISVPDTTAQGYYNMSTPISNEELRPGDLIFFTGTYNAGEPVTHIGFWMGDNKFIHSGGNQNQISDFSGYWTQQFYGFGRIG